MTLINYNIVYFAKTDAFSSGTLVETIRYVNPDIFYSVPRVYEKFEEKIRFVIESSQGLKRKIGIIKYYILSLLVNENGNLSK